MGKLRDGLSGADKLLKLISKNVENSSKGFEESASNAYQLMQTGAAGVDTLYEYLFTKLKKAGKAVKDAANDPVKDYWDNNVASFIKGINDLEKQACEFTSKWNTHGGTLAGDIARARGLLTDLGKQIDKKKKKLLQSTKYKSKIAGYAKTLNELIEATGELEKSLKKLMEDPGLMPPSVGQIKKNLAISDKSLVKDVEKLAAHSFKEMLKKYSEAKTNTTTETRKFRQAGDFSGEMKHIAEMVKESEGMEKESED